MKTRLYKTLSGKTVTALRPETEIEARTLELSVQGGGDSLDARHSLGDDPKRVKPNEETKDND
jgi:hypothetical protein